jgi:MmyB-like transcription regulator ligand binding domain
MTRRWQFEGLSVEHGPSVRFAPKAAEADAVADATPETAALLDRLLGYRDVRATISQLPQNESDDPILPMHFEKDRTVLRLFTTIATLGTPQDITVQELRIESFFPMDDGTREAFHKWSG